MNKRSIYRFAESSLRIFDFCFSLFNTAATVYFHISDICSSK